MKRFVLLFAVFTIWFSVPLSGQIELAVANGTTTNSYLPVYGLYTDSYLHEQVIYPASMLTGVTGQLISDITFYLSSSSVPTWSSSFNVSLGITNVDTFASSAYIQTEMTTLFTGGFTITEDKRLTIHFNTPYQYNGGNLLLDISSLSIGGYSSASFYGIASSNSSIYGYSDSGIQNITNMRRQNFIPKTTFSILDTCVTLDIAASDITGTSAMVSWEPNPSGAPHHYELAYKLSGASSWTSVPGNITDNYYFLTGLMSDTTYNVRLRTWCAGSYSNDLTTTFATECIGGGTSQSVTIGSGTNSNNGNYLPVNMYYKYSYSQQIFKAEELVKATSINQIDVQYFYNTPYTRNVDIYMGHTSKDAFSSSSDWIPYENLTLVYSGPINFSNAGTDYWLNIPLTTTFQYNGVDNLVVAFDDNTGSYNNSSSKFYTHESGAYRSLAACSDSYNYTPSNITASGSRYNYRMNLRLPSNCNSDGCDRGNVAVRNVTATTAKLIFAAGMASTSCEIQYCVTGSNYSTVNTNTSPYTLTGLMQNTSYTVRIRSHCSSGWTDWKYVHFTTKTKNVNRLYVKVNGTGDGVSWNEATRDLNWALRTASIIKSETGNAPDIWVAQGIYYGDTLSENAFVLHDGINVYGGFVGNEAATYNLAQRDFGAHPTVLDGNNARRVLYQESFFGTASTWDGFTIRNGHTNNQGGGAHLRGNITFRNCQFISNYAQNYGGGAYANGSSSYPILFEKCQFTGNHSVDQGGGVYSSYAIACHCIFTHNLSNYNGGAIYITSASSAQPTVSNCLLANNTASNGGGIYSGSSYASVENSTIVNNTATTTGGGLYSSSIRIVTNSILWGNRCNGSDNNIEVNSNPITCVYSAVENGYPGEGNISLLPQSSMNGMFSPKFVRPSGNAGYADETTSTDWHLKQGSICIDRGSDSLVTIASNTDLDGNPRVRHNAVDMGCYESDYETSSIPQTGNIVYVTQTGAGIRDGSSWANALNDISAAQALAIMNDANVWVAEGTYYGDTTSANAFTMLDGVDVYGGFAGNEPANFNLDQRNFEAHPTILDGMGARRVLFQPSMFLSQTTWDGFTIQHGNYTLSNNGGGGAHLLANSVLKNCIVTNNHSNYNGGGIYAYGYYNLNYTSMDSVRIINCTITNNNARDYGGGIYARQWTSIQNTTISYDSAGSRAGGVYAYDSYLLNCVVSHNKTNSSGRGGGIHLETSDISNCLVANNTAGVAAGIYSNSGGHINNCTVVNNESTYQSGGSGILGYSNYSSPLVSNSIIWGNTSLGVMDNVGGKVSMTHSAVEGGHPGDANITLISDNVNNGTLEPGFVNPSATVGAADVSWDADWHLQDGSPCINHGSNDYAKNYDLDGGVRVRQGTVDLGCYESDFNGITLPQYGNIVYVTQQGAGDQSGRNWDNATSSLQNALSIAYTSGADVWVAEGTYYGNEISQNAFTILEGVNVFGGFAGNEPENYDLSLRDFDAHPTILDGQNRQRVLYQPHNFTDTTMTVWDGFTIQNGSCMSNGAGVYLQSHSTLSHCIVQNNIGIYDHSSNYYKNCYGAGIYVNSTTSSSSSTFQHTTFISHCIIRNNTVENTSYLNGYGCGLYANYVSVNHTEISHNTLGYYGGGVYIDYAADFSNCLIHHNSSVYGGGLYLDVYSSYSTKFINCDIVNNSSTSNGGGIYRNSGSPTFTNSIIWGNKKNYVTDNIYNNSGTYTYCAIEEGLTGTNNLTLAVTNDGVDETQYYVRFMDPENGDYQLHPSSSCLNAGNNDVVSDSLDFYGNPRVYQAIVDIGCSESMDESNCPSVVNLVADNITTNSARLTWHPVGNESQWVVAYGMEGEQPTSVTVNSTTYNLTGLVFNRNYTAKVRSVCGDGLMSIFSIPANFQTTCDPSILTPLSDFGVMSPSDNSMVYEDRVDFSWAALPEATSYDFYIWLDGNEMPTTPTRSGLMQPGINEVPLPNFAHGNYYHWKVVAWNECISKSGPVMTIQVNPYPDLHVSAVDYSNPVATQQMTVTWTVSNDGEGNTPPGQTWNDYIWISPVDGVGDGFWYNVSEVLLATVPNLNSLDAGQSYQNSTTVTIPEGYIGSYFLFVFTDQRNVRDINYTPTGQTTFPNPYTPSADGNPYHYLSGIVKGFSWNHIEELPNHEYDNFFYKVITILPPPSPDLVVSSVVHGGDAISGNSTNITWTVANNGEAPAAGSWTDVVYLSRDTILDTEEDLRLGRFVHQGPLAAGDQYQRTEQVTIPVEYSGPYYYIVVTDNNNNIFEGIGEQNNKGLSQPITVTLTWLTDLEISSVELPTSVSPNGTYTCRFTVANNGSSPTYTNSWTDAIYISTEPVFNIATAIPLTSTYHFGVLDADASYTVQENVTIPDTLTQAFHWFVVIDNQNRVFEYDAEDNNIYAHPQIVTVQLPDLQVSNIEMPEVVNPNENVRVSWTVRNNGPGNLESRSFTDNMLFNGSSFYSVNATLISLAAGDSLVRVASLQLPCGLSSSAEFAIQTESQQHISESNENNNTHTIPVTITTPDLELSELTIPAGDAWSGAAAELSYTITNNGNVTASHAQVVDKIYFNTSADSFQESDLIDTFAHALNLAPQASANYFHTVTLPNGINGTYHYHIVCNANNTICENGLLTNNTANSRSVRVHLSPSPDLVITRVSAPENVYMGTDFQLTYTIKNQGNAALRNTNVMQKFYYSMSSATYDTNNLLAKRYDYLTLGSNDSATLVTYVSLPSNISPYRYYIHAVTDAGNIVYEHNAEDNNTNVSNSLVASVYQLDMLLSEISGPDVVQWGQSVTYRLHVVNGTNLPSLAENWQDVLYLSEDQTLQNSDRLLRTEVHRTRLESNADYWVDMPVTIPFGAPASAYLIGITNFNNENPDINPSNNLLKKTITVNSVPTPDLAVEDVVILDAVSSGQPARIAYKVTNIGEVPITDETWNDKLFLSSNDTYESSDVQLRTGEHSNITLAPGEFYRDTLDFTIPLPNNGSLYLLLMTNTTNTPYESNQTNNTVAAPVNVILPPPGDLVVRDVTCENTIESGQMLHATWNILNIGDNTMSGNGLKSLVYASSDTVFDANDRLLGNVTNAINLPIDQNVQQNLAFRINGLRPGNYYLIVKTDVTNAFNEANDDNNTGYSAMPFAVTIRPLPFNTDVADILVNNEVSDFMLNVEDNVNQTVRIHVTSADSNSVNMIYVTYNDMGDNLNYTYSTIGQFTANPELYIPATKPGFYGVNIYGSARSGNPQNVVVRADILPFELHSVNASHGGNTGEVTVELTGSRFRPGMIVSLRNDTEEIVADSLIYVNYYQCFAKFDLTNHTPGVYDVVALNNCEGEAILHDGFTIENGVPSGLSYNLIFPSSPRPNRNVVMLLEFGNTGNVDLHDQVLEITSIGGSYIALTPEGISQHRTVLQVPLSIDGEPEGLLRPGSYGTINIYGFTAGALLFTIKPVEE